jgi:hypothetical protein
MYRSFLIIVFLLVSISFTSYSQDNSDDLDNKAVPANISSEALRKQALNVFLDCRWCDRNYIKQVIPFVNYVTNKDEADVHIFVRRQINGGGGSEYIIDFIGHGEFEEVSDQLKFVSTVDETRDETRIARSGVISMGLMQFVARTPVGRNIKITYENKDVPEQVLAPTVVDDPWDSWVFRLRGTGSISRDENYNNTNYETSLSADRVTPELKIEFDSKYKLSQRVYKLVGTETIQRDWDLGSLIVKSLGPNWAFGGRARALGSIKNNYNLSASIGPAIEYNIFPYEESFKHQIRFQYGISGIFNDYADTTIYLKTEELVFRHHLSVVAGVNQQWGNGHIYIVYANYLHDFELNNLSLGGRINYRIYKGLSINLDTKASIIHDQVNLRLDGATTEEILTQQFALKSGYRYSFSVGLTYSFGSIYNNVVNTRFGN